MKIAIISDLHISTRWIGGVSILSQTISLSERLVDYCKSNGISTLCIAGDIVDKAIDRPEVMHTVNEMFRIFSSGFESVYYILGQHDMAVNPIGDINFTDSIINTIDYGNVRYMNNQILYLNNCSIGFANFSRDSRYKLDRPVDLYITHFTISSRFGQTTDTSKFGVMIAGDIHHRVNIGNMYSIGSFQQQSLSKDSTENNVCVYDTNTKSFEHVDIGGGIKMVSSQEKSGLIDGVYYVYKPEVKRSEVTPIVDKFRDDNYSKIVERVREFMESKGLEDMNSEIANQISDHNSFSSDFTIKSLKIHNFLKIKDVEVEFNKGDKVLLTGHNGSGKSTFLNALFAGLTGNVTWSHYVGKFDSEVSVEISLEYGGNLYTLRRGSGYQQLLLDSTEIPYKSRNDFNSVVQSKLPFLPELGILFQRPEIGTLFEGISSDSKIKLISKVYHLEYLDQLSATGESIKQGYKSKLKESEFRVKSLEAQYSSSAKELENLGDMEDDIYELCNRYNSLVDLKSKSDEYTKVKSEYDKLEAKKSAYEESKRSAQRTLDEFDESKYESKKSKLDKLNNELSEYKSLKSEVDSISNSIRNAESELSSILFSRCPRCNQLWVSVEASNEKDRLTKLVADLKYKLDESKSKLELLEISKSDFDLIPDLKSEIESLRVSRAAATQSLSNCTESIDWINARLKEINLPESCEFTQDSLNEMMEIKDKVSKLNKISEIKSQLDDISNSLTEARHDVESLQNKISEVSSYVWYVCRSGPIYRDILESLCESWSNDRVRFSIFEGVYRGNDYLDIKINYLKGTEWQDYSKSSSGEKSYMDILFIKSVTANAGFLILDEFLRHMDSDITERSIDEIKDMNVGLFILSSFNPNLNFAGKFISAQYIPESDECRISIS